MRRIALFPATKFVPTPVDQVTKRWVRIFVQRTNRIGHQSDFLGDEDEDMEP